MSLANEFAQLKLLAKELDKIELFTSTDWSSCESNHRLLVRKDIKHQLKLLDDTVLDLEKIPELPHGFVSISHSLQVGGYVYSPVSMVGLDIESTHRVNPDIIRRVSTQEELAIAPTPAHLWCAKEALYKALRGISQPKTISAIQFSSWQPIGDFYKAFSPLGQSFIWNNSDHGVTIAIALI